MTIELNVAVGCNRRYGQEELILGRNGIVEETKGFFGYNIGCMTTFIAYWPLLIPLPRAIQVLVRVWVQQKVRACKSSRIRRIVIVNRMRVEELAGIIGIDSRVL